MPLDRGLLECAKELMDDRYPEPVHIRELYEFLEKKYNFSDKQLGLHSQMAGQIEPHWMHDLRNLLGNDKHRKDGVINPNPRHWSLPRESIDEGFQDKIELMFDAVVKAASSKLRRGSVMRPIRGPKDIIFTVKYYGNKSVVLEKKGGYEYTLTKALFGRKICHLMKCGGEIPVGHFHNWMILESAMVRLSPELVVKDGMVHLS